MRSVHIHITGIVQGVGMRPFVYREAVALGVRGSVLNAGDGVHIEATAEDDVLQAFLRALREHAPAAARIEHIDVDDRADASQPADDFRIIASDDTTERTTLVSPDIATCPDCLRELFDPSDRRYHYPFINCTNCGPRFTIIRSLPYDRPATSMDAFPMCPTCAHEYSDPLDRRFHAQPDACFECGPHLIWRERGASGGRAAVGDAQVGTTREASDEIIARCAELLANGGIVAIKGLGGFHLACDATNEDAVEVLRARKRRPRKPFAVMMPSIRDVERTCVVTDAERDLLEGSVRPIVLLQRRTHATAASGDLAGGDLAPSVAFDLPELGVMLPYTPLQHLLLASCAEQGISALVMTSGNISGEPIEVDDELAWQRLVESGIADALLGNDRAILARFDDSVVRVDDTGRMLLVRRARGYAPQPVELPRTAEGAATKGAIATTPSVLTCGAEQKATLAFTRSDDAGHTLCFLSQHIGDVEQAATIDAWHETRRRIAALFDIDANAIVCDLHPSYLTAQWARHEAARRSVPLIEVQHHHAHIATAIAEAAASEGFDVHEPVVGIAFDGTGSGTDDTVWGGEVLIATLTGFTRAAHLATWPLPGGAAAIRDTRRCAYALLRQHDLLEHPGAARLLASLGDETRGILDTMLSRGINSPLTSSMGRFLDACAAILGICEHASYDGEPAIELEAAAASMLQQPHGADAASSPVFLTFEQKVALQFRYARCTGGLREMSTHQNEAPAANPQDSFSPEASTALQIASEGQIPRTQSRISELKGYISGRTDENPSHDPRATTTCGAPDGGNAATIDPAPLLTALLDGIACGDDARALALAVHVAVAHMASDVASAIASEHGLHTVALGGGVFMNRLVLGQTRALLSANDLRVLVPRRVPLNDGGIAYGQAAVAHAMIAEGLPLA